MTRGLVEQAAEMVAGPGQDGPAESMDGPLSAHCKTAEPFSCAGSGHLRKSASTPVPTRFARTEIDTRFHCDRPAKPRTARTTPSRTSTLTWSTPHHAHTRCDSTPRPRRRELKTPEAGRRPARSNGPGSRRTLKESARGPFQPRSAEVSSAPLPESFGPFKAAVIPPGHPGPGRLPFQLPARPPNPRCRLPAQQPTRFLDESGENAIQRRTPLSAGVPRQTSRDEPLHRVASSSSERVRAGASEPPVASSPSRRGPTFRPRDSAPRFCTLSKPQKARRCRCAPRVPIQRTPQFNKLQDRRRRRSGAEARPLKPATGRPVHDDHRQMPHR